MSQSESKSPLSDVAFASLGREPSIMEGIEAAGFTHCTPIQALTLPPALEGKDVPVISDGGAVLVLSWPTASAPFGTVTRSSCWIREKFPNGALTRSCASRRYCTKSSWAQGATLMRWAIQGGQFNEQSGYLSLTPHPAR